MANVIVYGGAFNPPTIAHQMILEKVCAYAKENDAEVWLLPSGNRRDKTIDVPTLKRFRYAQALVEDSNTLGIDVLVDNTELQYGENVETAHTIDFYNNFFPEYTYTWVFGADSTNTMPEWYQGDWILENVPMLVFERLGSEVNPKALHATTIDMPLIDVSSTLVRERMAQGLDYRDLVGPHVYEETQKNDS